MDTSDSGLHRCDVFGAQRQHFQVPRAPHSCLSSHSVLRMLSCLQRAVPQGPFSSAQAAGCWEDVPWTQLVAGLWLHSCTPSFRQDRLGLGKKDEQYCLISSDISDQTRGPPFWFPVSLEILFWDIHAVSHPACVLIGCLISVYNVVLAVAYFPIVTSCFMMPRISTQAPGTIGLLLI